MLTAETALALFSMLAISSISLLVAKRIQVPHTVFLVAVGIFLALFAGFPYLGFLDSLSLTPELIFFIFLPTLIFESAYNINVRHLTREALIISLLAIVSLCVSTIAIAIGLDFFFGLIGLGVPFILSLLFGAIISATDPVAVLALFKEYGAPRRLSLIFEGESIFNDGTAVALFLVILAVAESGVYHSTDLLYGTMSFIGMIAGGIFFGLIFGGVFTKLIGWTKSNEFAAITLTLVLAHTTFICAELFSHHVTLFGAPMMVSSIIATATASLLMGNYGRYRLPAHASEFIEKYWSHFAFLANSLVFIMIGMLVIQLPTTSPELLIPVLISILVVAAARALSIYPIVSFFNLFANKERDIPLSWQHVMAWGSLRGALAVTMVLMIPDELTFPGWSLSFTPKEFLLTLTVGCVFATLFIKATTIGSFMKRFKLSTFTSLEEINYREMLIYIYDATMKRLKEAHDKGYVTDEVYATIRDEQQARLANTLAELKNKSGDSDMLTKAVRLYAIGIERKYIRELFKAGEVSEHVIKRIMLKLEYQSNAIEHDTYNETLHAHGHESDVFEELATTVKRIFRIKRSPDALATERYLYYRALMIISRKVVKELARLDACFAGSFAETKDSIGHVSELYASYAHGSGKKLDEIRHAHPELSTHLDEQLISRAIFRRESHLLDILKEREMVTPKVSIALAERFESESVR